MVSALSMTIGGLFAQIFGKIMLKRIKERLKSLIGHPGWLVFVLLPAIPTILAPLGLLWNGL